MQKILKSVAILSLLSGGLTACGGAGSAGPVSSTQYGTLLSESMLMLPSNLNLTYVAMLAMAESTNGYYADISTHGGIPSVNINHAYESANVANTEALYNYKISDYLSPSNLVNPQAYYKVAEVKAYAITYTTPGVNAQTDPQDVVHHASGLVILPEPITQLRGVVLYYHPTSLGKTDVPSCILGATNLPNYCNTPIPGTSYLGIYAQLASIYAARGFAVIAPDYIGQGSDYQGVHPYVAYPEANAISGLNMLAPFRALLDKQKEPLSFIASDTTLPLFITGYSEGGAYVLRAAQLLQSSYQNYLTNNNLNLAVSSPQEGAYSLQDQLNFDFANLSDGVFNCENNPSYACGESDPMNSLQTNTNNYVQALNTWQVGSSFTAAQNKPALSAYLLNGVEYYSLHNLTGTFNQVMFNQFWEQIPINGSYVTLPQLFSASLGKVLSGDQITGAVTFNTTGINGYNKIESLTINLYLNSLGIPITLPASPNGYQIGYGADNSVFNFIHQNAVVNNPVFNQIIINGSTYNWKTNKPINFIHMAYDSVVPVINANQAYSCMKNGLGFPGGANIEKGQGGCNFSSANSNMIESTIIPNFQLTNNLIQLLPQGFSAMGIPALAISKFWAPNSLVSTTNPLLQPILNASGIPFDHANMSALGNIIALCSFENYLKDGGFSGVCPDLN